MDIISLLLHFFVLAFNYFFRSRVSLDVSSCAITFYPKAQVCHELVAWCFSLFECHQESSPYRHCAASSAAKSLECESPTSFTLKDGNETYLLIKKVKFCFPNSFSSHYSLKSLASIFESTSCTRKETQRCLNVAEVHIELELHDHRKPEVSEAEGSHISPSMRLSKDEKKDERSSRECQPSGNRNFLSFLLMITHLVRHIFVAGVYSFFLSCFSSWIVRRKKMKIDNVHVALRPATQHLVQKNLEEKLLFFPFLDKITLNIHGIRLSFSSLLPQLFSESKTSKSSLSSLFMRLLNRVNFISFQSVDSSFWRLQGHILSGGPKGQPTSVSPAVYRAGKVDTEGRVEEEDACVRCAICTIGNTFRNANHSLCFIRSTDRRRPKKIFSKRCSFSFTAEAAFLRRILQSHSIKSSKEMISPIVSTSLCGLNTMQLEVVVFQLICYIGYCVVPDYTSILSSSTLNVLLLQWEKCQVCYRRSSTMAFGRKKGNSMLVPPIVPLLLWERGKILCMGSKKTIPKAKLHSFQALTGESSHYISLKVHILGPLVCLMMPVTAETSHALHVFLLVALFCVSKVPKACLQDQIRYRVSGTAKGSLVLTLTEYLEESSEFAGSSSWDFGGLFVRMRPVLGIRVITARFRSWRNTSRYAYKNDFGFSQVVYLYFSDDGQEKVLFRHKDQFFRIRWGERKSCNGSKRPGLHIELRAPFGPSTVLFCCQGQEDLNEWKNILSSFIFAYAYLKEVRSVLVTLLDEHTDDLVPSHRFPTSERHNKAICFFSHFAFYFHAFQNTTFEVFFSVVEFCVDQRHKMKDQKTILSVISRLRISTISFWMKETEVNSAKSMYSQRKIGEKDVLPVVIVAPCTSSSSPKGLFSPISSSLYSSIDLWVKVDDILPATGSDAEDCFHTEERMGCQCHHYACAAALQVMMVSVYFFPGVLRKVFLVGESMKRAWDFLNVFHSALWEWWKARSNPSLSLRHFPSSLVVPSMLLQSLSSPLANFFPYGESDKTTCQPSVVQKQHTSLRVRAYCFGISCSFLLFGMIRDLPSVCTGIFSHEHRSRDHIEKDFFESNSNDAASIPRRRTDRATGAGITRLSSSAEDGTHISELLRYWNPCQELQTDLLHIFGNCPRGVIVFKRISLSTRCSFQWMEENEEAEKERKTVSLHAEGVEVYLFRALSCTPVRIFRAKGVSSVSGCRASAFDFTAVWSSHEWEPLITIRGGHLRFFRLSYSFLELLQTILREAKSAGHSFFSRMPLTGSCRYNFIVLPLRLSYAFVGHQSIIRYYTPLVLGHSLTLGEFRQEVFKKLPSTHLKCFRFCLDVLMQFLLFHPRKEASKTKNSKKMGRVPEK